MKVSRYFIALFVLCFAAAALLSGCGGGGDEDDGGYKYIAPPNCGENFVGPLAPGQLPPTCK